jgi:hypothetical protein
VHGKRCASHSARRTPFPFEPHHPNALKRPSIRGIRRSV